MPINYQTKFFKHLEFITKKRNDVVSSIIFETETVTSLVAESSQPQRFTKQLDFVKDTSKILINKSRSFIVKVKKLIKVTPLPVTWAVSSMALFMVVAISVVIFPTKVRPNTYDKYSIYSSKSLTLQETDYEIYTRDSRAQRINEIYRIYDCPMEGLGEVLVYEADKNDIPWWLVASISFQESTCGKYTPEVEGVESYNAWGWGVYGDNVHSFTNYVRGIERVSRYLSERFYSQGVTDVCEIMRTYTPPSNGSWCEGVKYFRDQMVDYKTPLTAENILDPL